MRVKYFFLGIPLGLSLACAAWFLLVAVQLGAPSASSQWVADVVNIKHGIAEKVTQDKRIFLIGGSNVLFGIDAKRMEQALESKVINFGLSAIMRPQKIFEEAMKELKPGDTAIIAMEYSYYKTPQRMGEVELDYMMAHDEKSLLQMPILDRAEAMLGVGLVRLFEGLWSTVFSYDGTYHGAYQSRTMDAYGNETINDIGTMPKHYKEMISHLKPARNSTTKDDSFWLWGRSFALWCESHGVKLFATFPSYLYFDAYEMHDESKFFHQVMRQYENIGVPVLGDAFMFMYDSSDMYDTRYHLNSKGRVKRTDTLISLLYQHQEN